MKRLDGFAVPRAIYLATVIGAATALSVTVAGCGASGGRVNNGGFDLALATDLAPPLDLAAPTVDLATSAGELGGQLAGFVVNRLILPMSRSEFSIDLDGDGRVDNGLAQIVSVLAGQGLDLQSGVDGSVASGQQISIVELRSGDAAFQDDPGAGVTFANGVPRANPDYSGMGTFNVDNASPPSQFLGPLVAGAFSSENPVTTRNPVQLGLKLLLFPGGSPVTLPLNGAHINCRAPANGQGTLMSGQIQGSVRTADLQTSVIPQLAMFLTAKIQNAPMGDPTADGIRRLFDSGGCTNPNGTMAVKGDNKIDICELASNQTIASLLGPDVQIFNPPGSNQYGPVPRPQVLDPKNRDSLSIAVGFTAVNAKVIH